MTESLSHKSLKIQAKQMLLSEGFSEDKIQIDTYWFDEEVNGIKLSFRVDVYAINGHKRAIECGNFPRWKRLYYEKHFGKENIKHIPYPENHGRYLIKNILEGDVNDNEAKQFLIDTYIKDIYAQFKDDEIYNFQELRGDNINLFDLGPHGKYREINPDYGYKFEVEGHKIWMNFPTEKTITKNDFMNEIHIGMIYHQKDTFSLVILLSGKEAMKKFLKLSVNNHEKVFDELKKLPSGFKIRQGFSFWEKKPVPPLNKEWNDPIECNELTKEDYDELLRDQENLMEMGKFNMGPTLDLVKIYVKKDEIPEALEKLKPLYSLLIKPQTVVDDLVIKIKTFPKWQVYLERHMSRELTEECQKRIKSNIELGEVRKAMKILKEDKDYLKYI